MKRRLLAFFSALCIAIGIFAVPTGPRLVCRMTGRPMAAILPAEAGKLPEAARVRRACCLVKVQPAATAAGGVRYALARPGCCDLRQGAQRHAAPATPTAHPDRIVAALAPAPPVLFVPPALVPLVRPEIGGNSAPRGPPPLSAASPRAPPFFS